MKTDPSSLESVCMALPGMTEGIKWGNDPGEGTITYPDQKIP